MAPTHTKTRPAFAQVAHDVSHAWHRFSAFVARGGTEFLPEVDDPHDVYERMERMPEGLRDRLDPSFAALERANDPQGRYRAWYKKLCENYTAAMIAARLIAGPDQEKRYQECARVVKETPPSSRSTSTPCGSSLGAQKTIPDAGAKGIPFVTNGT